MGFQAQQSLTIKVKNLDAKGQKVATLVDALAQVDGINIDSVSFDIFDKSPLQTGARADAFKDAKAKAEDYAFLAGSSLGKLLTIDDYTAVQAAPIPLRAEALASFAGGSSKTSVPVG